MESSVPLKRRKRTGPRELRSVLTTVTDTDQFNFLLSENIPDELELLPPNPILTDDFDAELAAQAGRLFRSIERDELGEQERKRGHYGRMYLQKKMRSASRSSVFGNVCTRSSRLTSSC